MTAARDPVPPCWIDEPFRKPRGPGSWVVYVVAKIDAHHRPLAVLSLRESDIFSIDNDRVIDLCRRGVAAFSDPTNRTPLMSELSLAAGFYNDPQTADLPVHELPDVNHIDFINRRKIAPLYHNIPEFPFISTCLLLASGRPFTTHPQPLGAVFRDESPFYGMVVFDISRLDEVRYGIVAFSAQPIVFIETREEWRNYIELGHELRGKRELRVEDERPRVALSVKSFADKFGCKNASSGARLEKVPLIETAAFDLVWPLRSSDSDANRPLKRQFTRSLRDRAIITLIESTLETDAFDMSLFDEPRKLPSFQDSLRRLIQAKPELLGQSQSTAQLIALAFEGKKHLDLARQKGLTAGIIRTVLEMDELKQIESICICIDRISSPLSQLVEVLSSFPTLRDVCLLQSPTRETDLPSAEMFLELHKNSKNPLQRVVIAGIYSTSLRRQPWLPETGFTPPISKFPVHYVFHREQHRTRRNWWNSKRYFVGDGLLAPHHFAAGFLHWLESPDFALFAFARGPPNLEEISRIEVTPVPAENFHAQRKRSSHASTRGLVRGSWCAVASVEKYFDNEAQQRNIATGGWEATDARHIKFALVQLLIDVEAKDMPVVLNPEDVRVCGLKEFLNDTTEEGVDAPLVERRIAEVGEKIADWPNQGRLGVDLEWVGVMNNQEGLEALNQLLKSTFL
ncbi:uncharacterized protein F4822DRAFT_412827 [Hypoxylon trugodes]|uniref:uncharacterized protein n=1 Tax=Hypoxylon trugodes TaxID=326681 RepID=UPI00219F78E3|nr:uncharacterized protein F4822DRAFT_412827 [Hypoxylon trugodes]KAI1385352.1 hypothetical protein F4822DRAFT_412827 [Hypoxylon trugodes]